MPNDTSLYLAPCASEYPQEHFEDTVQTSLSRDWYEEYTDRDYGDEIWLWANTEGSRGIWQTIEEGDYLIFYFGEEGYRYAARVQDTEHNREFGIAAWPVYERKSGGSDSSDPYELIIILEEPFELDLDRAMIQEFADHDIPYPPRFMAMNDPGLREIRERYDSVDWFVERHRIGPNVWIEETAPENKVPKEGLKLGDSIWSPQADDGGADRYNVMREPVPGDIVLHVLQDGGGGVVGISSIASELDDDFIVPQGSDWAEPGEERAGYKYDLHGYQELDRPIDFHAQIFENDRYQDDLEQLDKRFQQIPYNTYGDGWRLQQGMYLARTPSLLVEVLAEQSVELKKAIRERGYVVPFDQKPFDGEKLLAELTSREPTVEMYREALAHLVAGKNVVFYGAPGTGKTRAARELSRRATHDFSLETAHSEWTRYDVVGGYEPTNDGSYEPAFGYFGSAAAACVDAQTEHGSPHWLIIDELNRANLDEAFGDIFTFLDIDYRTDETLDVEADLSTPVPLSFRVLATMNTYDRAKLFSLGLAFMRRFAFVGVESLLRSTETGIQLTGSPDPGDETYLGDRGSIVDTVQAALVDQFTLSSTVDRDTPLVYNRLADNIEIENFVEEALANPDLAVGDHSALDRFLIFGQEATNSDVVEIGQALVMDAAKYVVTYQLLYPSKDVDGLVDTAVMAYIFPQFTQYLPELRRARTIERAEGTPTALRELQETATNLDLPRTRAALETMEEDLQVL